MLLLAALVLTLLVATFFLVSYHFKDHFYPHTEINGLKVGGMSAEEAEEKIATDVGDYLLTLHDRDGNKYHITGRDIDCRYLPDGALGRALEEQNMYAWIPALFREHILNVDTPMAYDKDKLVEAVAALPCFQEENITYPVDAFVQRGESAYEIVPEQPGNQMILDRVAADVMAAVTAGEGNLTLTDEDYVPPKLTQDSPQLVGVLEQIEGYMGAEITYQISDYGEKLDSSEIFDMLSVDENMRVLLDEEKITDFVQDLATKYNTYADVREFATSSGDVVEIGGGDYGWVIDKAAEAELIRENIQGGEPVTREPAYSQRAQQEGLDDIGDTYVEIDYTKQHMWYYEEGTLILESDIVSGNVSRGNGSPDGLFKIVYKQSPAVLKGEDYASDVEYFMPFAYNVGIHDASWRSQFGGEYYKTSGSHGCVNVPGAVAKELYGRIKVDTPVIAYYREPVELTAENCKISNAYSYVDPEAEPEAGSNPEAGAGTEPDAGMGTEPDAGLGTDSEAGQDSSDAGSGAAPSEPWD